MYSVEKLQGEPIIVVRMWGELDVTVVKREIAQQVAEIIENNGGKPHWRIIDYSDYELTFSDITFGLALEASGKPGTSSDKRVRSAFVGTAQIVKEKAEAYKQAQYGRLDVPVFSTLDEALATIRADKMLPSK